MFHIEDIKPKSTQKEKTAVRRTKRGDGEERRKQLAEKNKFKRLTYDVGRYMHKAQHTKKSDKFTRWHEDAKEHNRNLKSKTSSPPKLESLSNPTQSNPFDPNPFIIPIEDTTSTSSDSDSDDYLFTGKNTAVSLDPRAARMLRLARQDLDKAAEFQHPVQRTQGPKKRGGSKTRKKSKRFRNNLRKNKISRKYIMLKQCGGGKAKMGSKSKPYSTKGKAMKSRRRVCYYKKKGRTLKLKKKKKSSTKSRRRR